MSSHQGPLRTYLEILRSPNVALPVAGTALASLPIGMLSLAVLLLVENEGGGLGPASTVVALLGAGTGIGIALQGRLMDRFGHPRVLLTSVSVQALSLAAMVLALDRNGPSWLVGATAFAAGLGEPQVGGCLRALWPSLVQPHQRLTAAALSSMVFELPVVSGPLVLAGALLVVSPESTVLIAGGLFLSGSCIIAASRAARQWKPTAQSAPGLLGPLASGRVRRVIIVAAMQGVVTGLLQVSCVAFATQEHQAGVTGVLYATLSVGSLSGTFLYGLRSWPGNQRSQIAALTSVLVAVLSAAAVAGNLVVFVPLVLLVGLCLGPVTVCCFVEAERATPQGTAVAAFTSLTAVGLMTTAGGTALAGHLVDWRGTPPALIAAATCMALATAAVALGRRSRQVSSAVTQLGSATVTHAGRRRGR